LINAQQILAVTRRPIGQRRDGAKQAGLGAMATASNVVRYKGDEYGVFLVRV